LRACVRPFVLVDRVFAGDVAETIECVNGWLVTVMQARARTGPV
jgi:hypothetical protein